MGRHLCPCYGYCPLSVHPNHNKAHEDKFCIGDYLSCLSYRPPIAPRPLPHDQGGLWSCPYCKSVNFGAVLSCTKCGAGRELKEFTPGFKQNIRWEGRDPAPHDDRLKMAEREAKRAKAPRPGPAEEYNV